jgi:hypothetical protein
MITLHLLRTTDMSCHLYASWTYQSISKTFDAVLPVRPKIADLVQAPQVESQSALHAVEVQA